MNPMGVALKMHLVIEQHVTSLAIDVVPGPQLRQVPAKVTNQIAGGIELFDEGWHLRIVR